MNEFSPSKRGKDGRRSHCRACCNEEKKQRAAQNPKSMREYAWKRAGIECTIDEYTKKFTNQGGKCALCGKHQSEQQKAFSVDHNHVTGQVRDLLCSACNVALGIIENSAFMMAAQKYLDKHNAHS